MPTTLEQPGPTFNDIWHLFQETDRQMKERAAETDRQMKETDLRLKETDRQMTERAAEADLRLKETDRQIKERAAKFEREMEAQSVENNRLIKNMTQSIGKLGNRLGDFVEEMVKPGLVRLFQARGLKVHRTMQNLTCRDDHGQFLAQVDLLVVDSDTAIAVECKSHLSIDDVNDHVERMAMFKSCWPEYAAYKLLGGVAAMVLPEDVGRYAYRKGLYVLAQSGEAVEIRNDAGFQPVIW